MPQQIHALIEDRYNVSYHPAHLSRKLRAVGVRYTKPRSMDPRHPADAKEIFAERLDEALGDDGHETGGNETLIFGFFDEAWAQPFENSQRMWSFDRTVQIEKPLVTFVWRGENLNH